MEQGIQVYQTGGDQIQRSNKRDQIPRHDIAWGGPRSNMGTRVAVGAVATTVKKYHFSHHIRSNLPPACMHQETG